MWLGKISKSIWKKRGTAISSFLNIFHTNSDLNIFGNYSKHIENKYFPNILQNKYE